MKKTIELLTALSAKAAKTVAHSFFAGTVDELQVWLNADMRAMPVLFVDLARLTEGQSYTDATPRIAHSATVIFLVQAAENDTPTATIVSDAGLANLINAASAARGELKAIAKTLQIGGGGLFQKATLENVAGVSYTYAWATNALC